MGLLPQIARDLHVSIPAAGLLVTGYAIAVAVGAPVLTIALNKVERKTALLSLLILFIAGNALAAVANTYGVLMLARIIAALNHGSFFGIAAIVASSLAPKERAASAVATVFFGLTAAMVFGVPFGAFVGQRFGWHTPFGIIALIGVAAFIALWRFIPRTTIPAKPLGSELKALASAPVLAALATTLLGFAGVFCVFTYISPLLEDVTRLSPDAVAATLVLFGFAACAGNIVYGRIADRSLAIALLTSVGGLAFILAISSLMWRSELLAEIATFGIGFFAFAAATPLQLLAMKAARNAPNLVSSVNQSAFNIGNGTGAAIGAGMIASGAPLTSLGLAAAAVTVAGAVLALLTLRLLAKAESQELLRAA